KADFASSVDTVGVPGIKKTYLIKTSSKSRLLPDPVRVRFTVIVNPPRDEQFNKPEEAVAVLLEGEFPSAFKQLKLYADQFKAKGVGGSKFVTKGVPARMIVVSDGDMIENSVSADGRIAPLGSDHIEQYIFANKDFILNSLEYLTDDTGLMQTRAKEIKLRPLDKAKVRESRNWWTFMSIAAPVLILFLFGGIYNIIRYRRYSSLADKVVD
ncbi:MAG: ABC-2 type transport system permease protein, partial [Limisphaerales bacterium]